MSQVRIYRAADYPRTPWKNGAGSTQEIARDAGADLEDFGWRLSIAAIGESGGFSLFTGYQRVISVLQGAGMQLQVDGLVSRPLQAFEPFAFAGDSQVECRLLGAGIEDFNLIYAPHRYRARLQWLTLERPQRLFSSSATLLLFSACDGLEVRLDGAAGVTLGRYDCLQVECESGLVDMLVQAAIAGNCCLIELTPR